MYVIIMYNHNCACIHIPSGYGNASLYSTSFTSFLIKEQLTASFLDNSIILALHSGHSCIRALASPSNDTIDLNSCCIYKIQVNGWQHMYSTKLTLKMYTSEEIFPKFLKLVVKQSESIGAALSLLSPLNFSHTHGHSISCSFQILCF